MWLSRTADYRTEVGEFEERFAAWVVAAHRSHFQSVRARAALAPARRFRGWLAVRR